jgi:nitrite reductase (NADH) small subunit
MTLSIDRHESGLSASRRSASRPFVHTASTASHRAAVPTHADAWRRVCPVAELEPGWGEVALLADRRVAMFRLGDTELYAVDHVDPTTSAPVMARGIVGSMVVDANERPTVASPLLKQVYDLATGECLSGPGPAITTYRTRVVAGYVEIELAA